MPRIGHKQAKLPKFLTRLFDRDHFESYKSGYFRFSSLSSYTKGEGRFSDDEEGHRLRGYSAEDEGRVTIPALGLLNVAMRGATKADLLLSDKVDFLVACLSRGSHDIARSHAIMAHNPNLKQASFVVYNSENLVRGLTKVLARPEWFSDIRPKGESGMVGRPINYSDRMTLERLESFSGTELTLDDVTRMIWTKPEDFSHEDEYRFGLFGTNFPRDGDGLLSQSIIIEQHRLIRAAIVCCGDVPDP
ncbi:MAG: hypothetical protein V4586_09755 [Pseudomonadota bacterium]